MSHKAITSYIFSFFIMTTAFCSMAMDSDGQTTSRYLDGEELILDVRTERYNVGEIISVVKNGEAYLNLNDMFSVIDFPISASGNRFEGWFVNESNRFRLDFSTNERTATNKFLANVGPNSFELTEEDFVFVDGLYFVRASMFSAWFKLNIQLNYTDLELFLDPESPLPFQIRLARQNSSINSSSTSKVARFPHLYRGYGVFSAQSLDASLGVTSRDGETTTRYSLLGKRDIGFVNTRFFASGFDDDLIANGRFTLSKESTDNDLLGFLGASTVEAGDVIPVSISGVTNTSIGKGIFVSNRNLYQSFNLDTVDLTGQIDLNWDVELYRNNVLIDKLTAVTSGQYEFIDVSLFYGENNLVLKFYGPQGQFKEESYQQVIDRSTQLDRPFEYSFSIIDKNKDLFNSFDTAEEDSGLEISGQYRFGLFDDVTMRVIHTHTVNDVNPLNALSTGLTGRFFERFIWSTDFAITDDNYIRSQSSLRTVVGGQNFSLNYSFVDADSEQSQLVSVINSGTLTVGDKRNISYQNEARFSENDEFINEFSISNNIGFKFFDSNVYHQIQFFKRTDERTVSDIDILSGSVNIQKSIGRTLTRLGFSYNDLIDGKFGLSAVNANFSWLINREWSTTLDYQYLKLTDTQSIKAGFEYNSGAFFVNSNFSYFDNDNWLVGLNARISLSYDSQSDRVFSSFRSSVNTGTVFVRVFIDKNGNAKYDDTEYVIENAPVRSIQSSGIALTDKNGVAFLTGLTNQKRTDIYVDMDKVEEPYLIPLLDGFSITPRAGVVETVDFPLTYYSEIEGNFAIKYLNGNLEDGVNYTVELVDKRKNTVVQNTRTSYDGYFLFDKVPSGKYVLRIGSNKRKDKMFLYEELSVVVSNEPVFINNKQITATEVKHRSGFVTVIAEFDTKEKALLYSKVIKNTSAKPYLKNFTLLSDVRPNTYSLATGYFSNIIAADAHCLNISIAGLSCNPISYTTALISRY